MGSAQSFKSLACDTGQGRDMRVADMPVIDRSGLISLHLVSFAAVLLGWQLILLTALLAGLIAFSQYLACHLVSCILLAVSVFKCFGPIHRERNVALQMIAWSTFVGAGGAIVAIALALRSTPHVHRRESADLAEAPTDRRGDTPAERLQSALRNHRVRIHGARNVRPLMDVMIDGSRSDKLEALAVVFRTYDASLARLLKRALEDPDASVRVLAATVIARLNALFSRRIGERQANSAIETTDAKVFLELADARLAYAASGLLEPTQARGEADAAMAALLRAREINPLEPGLVEMDHATVRWRHEAPANATSTTTDRRSN
ncbi:hypothetical protein ACQR1I_27375 [Bradyrhizobium sp. HKCCYLS2038]|uniref:hypothetical protein n=1 Tax=unclassified Bradyrhizobium TaxID=2631580 RepID=UPI003EBE263C